MQTFLPSLLGSLLLTSTLVGCSDDAAPTVSPPTPSAIAIKSAITPALVAFQDGFGAPWQTATGGSITVNGPYAVAVVCQLDAGDTWLTWETAQTPDDGATVTAPCNPAPAGHQVTGTMVQPGRVSLGAASAASPTGNWSFDLTQVDGTYDLIAASDTQVLMKRAVALAGTTLPEGAIDVSTGVALVPDKLTVSNPLDPKTVKDETFSLEVDVTTKANGSPAPIFVGDPAAAKLVPAAALADGDVQTITLGSHHAALARSVTRAFTAGDAADIALPGGFGDIGWFIDAGRLSVIATSGATPDALTIEAIGAAGDGKVARHVMVVSSNYVNGTGQARPILDTAMPGYDAAWKLDVTKLYTRSLSATLVGTKAQKGDTFHWSTTEAVDPDHQP